MSNQQKILDLPEEYKSRVKIEGKTATVDSEGLYYKDLNCILRKIVCNSDVEKLVIQNVCGQRYIGTDLNKNLQIEIHGTPGNDLGAFMSGPKVIVHGSAQDASGNTMDEGEIIVEGHAGDLTGHSMRGGKIFVRDNVGFRVGIHMKQYQKKTPKIVVGQTAGDFLAEYMAGGIIVILGLDLKDGEKSNARFVATGMHGGVIYERGDILTPELGTKTLPAGKRDMQVIEALVKEYAAHFEMDPKEILNKPFLKILPISKRPYAKLYSH